MKKKLLQILTAAVVSVSFVGGVASAATCDGDITLTGPNSNNTISCNNVENIVVECKNNVYVATVNYQEAESGEGEVENNTTAGNAVTGSVVNDNGTNVTVGAKCGVTESPAPSPAAPVTPAGQGGAGAGGAGNAAPVQPAALPFTASNSAATIVLASLAAAAAIVVASRVAVAAYRRSSVNK